MKTIRKIAGRFEVFDWLSFGLIAVVLGLALTYWHRFPVHMDTFYHMGVTAGFSKAGGVALHSFWEFAPAGRPHLYPPLLHVLMFTLTKCGLSMLSAGRLTSFSAFPLLMLTGWYGMRRLFSSRAAFYTTVLLSSCYLLFWHSAVESAASLVMILTPLIFVAVDRERKVVAAVLLALALYSHLTLGHLVALCLLIYAIHRRRMFMEVFEVLLGAYLLWLPWGIHVLLNRGSLGFSNPTGGAVTVHIFIWLCALAGSVYCYFKKGRYYLLPAFLLGFIPILFFYPDRFWNSHAFPPLAMLGGVALSALHGLLKEKVASLSEKRARRTTLVAAAMAVPVAVLLLLDPVYSSPAGKWGAPPRMAAQAGRQFRQDRPPLPAPMRENPGAVFNPGRSGNAGTAPAPPPPPTASGGQPPSTPPGVAPGQGGPGRPAGPFGPPGPGGGAGLRMTDTTILSLALGTGVTGQQSLHGRPLIDAGTLALADIVKKNSKSDDIVFTPDGSTGNLITGLTGRASTGGMFHEVRPYGGMTGDPRDARLLLLPGRDGRSGEQAALPGPGGPGTWGRTGIDTADLKLVGTAGGYRVYLNRSATAGVARRGWVIPWYVVFIVLAPALAATLIDRFRTARRLRATPSPGP